MTQSAPPPQDLAAATFRGWGELTSAWVKAATRWWFTIVEWAVDECAYTGVNQTTAYATVDATTPLCGRFYRVDGSSGALLADTCVTVAQTTDAALAKTAPPSAVNPLPHASAAVPTGAVVLVVTIVPGPGVVPGGYRGTVINKVTGDPVAESLYIYVATSS